MPTSSYTFKVLLEGSEAIAAAKRIRAELEKELSQGFAGLGQAQQQMGGVATMSQTTACRMAGMAGEMRGVTKESGRLEIDLTQADDATRQMVGDLVRSGASADQLERALRGGGQAVEDTRQKVKWLGRDLQEVAKMGGTERFGAALSAAASQTYGMRALAGGVGRAGMMAATAGATIIGPLTLAGKSYLEFADDADRAARQLKLNTDLTGYLEDKTLDLSASLGLFKPEEISAGLYTWAGALGAVAESEKDIDRLLEDSVEIQKLAKLSGEDLGTTTEYVAAIMGEFNMDASQTGRVVALLNYTADRTAATVGDLGESFKFVGPMAHVFGEDIEDIAAVLGVAADAGIKQSMAGRALRQMYISLADPTKEMTKAFNEVLGLSEDLGQSWQDIVFPGGEFIGTAEFIDLLAAATEDMTDQQRVALLAQMATANELPVLTAMVVDQTEARKEGINALRAWEKQAEGLQDAETERYTVWRETTRGIKISLEDMFESWAREWLTYEEGDKARADRMAQRWSTAWLRIGKIALESAIPALEKLADLMDEISRYAKEHPETVKTALETGAILTGLGAFLAVAKSGIQLYADIKMITAAATMYAASGNMLKAAGIQATTGGATATVQVAAAGTQTAAAGTQTVAAGTQMDAATLQATSGKNLLGGLGGISTLLKGAIAIVGGFEVGLGVTNVVRQAQGEEALGQGEALGKIGAFVGQLAAMTAGTGGALTAAILGEDPVAAFEEATYEVGKLLGVVEDTTAEIGEWPDETRYLKGYVREAADEVENLGDELMQLPTGLGEGLAAFREAELQAIDELESYLRARDKIIQEQNDKLAKMQEEFNREEDARYQDHLKERAKLEKELAEVTEEPLWRETEEFRKVQERRAEAQREYNRDIQKAIEEHQKKLRDLKEDHDEKMEDMEAARDAKGIIQERKRYDRAREDEDVRLAETKDTIRERLDETLQKEAENIVKLREERKADLQEKLTELDQNYADETAKRQEQFALKLTEQQTQNQEELNQLEEAHAQRLASIMGWEEKVKEELRKKYIGREADLRAHLAQMEQMYREMYDLATEAAPTTRPPGAATVSPVAHRRIPKRRQSGGYADYGTYLLGEAGPEFVLSSPTTRALERAIGPLTQEKLFNSASTYYGSLDVRVRADDKFSPAFAKQTEDAVRAQIVELAERVTKKRPAAWRPS